MPAGVPVVPVLFNIPVTVVFKLIAGVVLAVATVPAKPLALVSETLVTVQLPVPAGPVRFSIGPVQLPLAFK